MRILIPSRARPDAQITAHALQHSSVDYLIVRTPHDDTTYSDEHPQILTSGDVVDIASKRNWIMQAFAGQKILVIDDDITFHRVLDGCAFPAGAEDIRRMLRVIEERLDDFAHLGVARRYMIQSQPQPYVVNKKPKSVNAYNLALFPDPVPQFRLKACSDIDYTMQLIASGRSCVIVTEYCYTEADYMAPGGCSVWRTKQTIHEGMTKLAELWPRYVRLRGGPDDEKGTLATILLKKLADDHGATP
jgi:hypothetical protein